MVKEHIDTTLSTFSIDGISIDGIRPGSIPFPKPKRDSKPVTTLKDYVMRFGLKLLDPGTASFNGIKIPGDPGQIALLAASNDGKEHTFQAHIPEGGITFEYSAFVSTDYPSEEDDNTLFFNVELQASGEFTESTAYADITKIEGAAAGITYFPATASTALPATSGDVILHETTGITTDTIKVTAAASSYIGISYDGGRTWSKLTSGTPATFSTSYWPSAGGIAKALLKVMEDNKATRFVNLFLVRASS